MTTKRECAIVALSRLSSKMLFPVFRTIFFLLLFHVIVAPAFIIIIAFITSTYLYNVKYANLLPPPKKFSKTKIL